MRTGVIHLINPKADSLTTRPLYLNRALYSPLAGLLAVAALIPPDRYEVILTDENIEAIDFELKADLVGISAMTAYVDRGYEIADIFRRQGVPVVMGGVHPSFMAAEALQHADAVVVGEAELVMDIVLADLERGEMRGIYKSDRLCSMAAMPMPRYDLIKQNRYVNRAFIQTSRGCHQACTFCAESMMNGVKFRYRPLKEVLREIDECGQRRISINDANFFGTRERPKEIMSALRGRGISWQAGVTSRLAEDDEMLELAAASGCYMLSIGLESISPATLRSVHKTVNRPERFARLVEKIHSYGIMVFGLFMFGFDTDREDVFEETVRFNIQADFDVCAYSVLTPYPGTLTWYEMKRAGRLVSHAWHMYDQGHIVFRPLNMTPEQLRDGHQTAAQMFYAKNSILKRFPVRGRRSRSQWIIYNLFLKKGTSDGSLVAEPTPATPYTPMPPILPQKREWREAVLADLGRN